MLLESLVGISVCLDCRENMPLTCTCAWEVHHVVKDLSNIGTGTVPHPASRISPRRNAERQPRGPGLDPRLLRRNPMPQFRVVVCPPPLLPPRNRNSYRRVARAEHLLSRGRCQRVGRADAPAVGDEILAIIMMEYGLRVGRDTGSGGDAPLLGTWLLRMKIPRSPRRRAAALKPPTTILWGTSCAR